MSMAVVGREAPLPLSWAQQRLWFLDQLDQAAGAAYHMPAALHMHGELDHAVLQASLDRIVSRHESLRTRIVDIRGEPAQTFASTDMGFTLRYQDLSDQDPAARSVTVARVCSEEASERFDLSSGPLIRGRLLRLASNEHVLLLTKHHIVSDGWSVGVLVRELSALYTAFCRGHADPLQPLPIQYADYAVWQRQYLHGEQLQRQIEFWRAHLAGAPALLALPSDRPRPPVQSYAGACQPVIVPATLVSAIDALANRHGVTPFMVLFTGWSMLLSRLSGQRDVVVGTPVANRLRHEVEPLIGLFVNTLAIRSDIDSSCTVAQMLSTTRSVVLDAFEHQELPFEQVVDAVQPARSLGHSPLFQTMLTFDNTPHGDVLELPGLTLTRMPSAQDSTRYDLSLSLRRDGDAMVGEIEYATDLYNATTIDRYFGYFQIMLEAMCTDDRQRVGELPLMSNRQRACVVNDFNAATSAIPEEQRLHRLFEASVERDPQALALIDGEYTLSYAELNVRANRLAHRLLELGVKPDDCIALCVERSAAMIVGMLGILKAGGAYVPLDPGYPIERLLYMLNDSRPSVLAMTGATEITTALHAAAETQALAVVDIDELSRTVVADAANECNPDAGDIGIRAHHLAHVIYTSGSTGQPKGVMVEHGNVAHLIANHIVNCRLAPGDRMLQFASYSFDSSVVEIFPTLAAGATLVLRPAHLLAPDENFVEFISENAVNIVDLPTAFFHLWAKEASAGRALPHPGLRLIVVGGEALEDRHLATWLSTVAVRDCVVLNTYGPTEAAVYAAAIRHDSPLTADTSMGSIGRPVANTRVYLLDPMGAPVPQGVIGEICIAGPQVARGYLGRHELTAERFSIDPFQGDGIDRLYKTGDLGRWRMDGSIEFIGRKDFQVKIRGFRIELGEIEAHLAACIGVQDAVVLAREDQPGEKRLVAYVVMASEVELSTSSLRDALAINLAEFMIPSAFIAMPAFPLTPNGKIDRKALPAPNANTCPLREYVAPIGEYEERMAQIWMELLGMERIGRDDRFFEVGGNSLVITRLGFAVKEAFGVTANVGQLYGLHSLRDMAAFCQDQCERRTAIAESTVVFDL
jgi:amino acid adenylation domain-containing protein